MKPLTKTRKATTMTIVPSDNEAQSIESESGEPALRLSATRFKTFETCPKQWAFENMIHPDHELRNEAAAVGTAVHAAIEAAALARYEKDLSPIVLADELIELLEVYLVENQQPLSVAGKVDALSIILNLGKINFGTQAVEPEHEWIMDLEGVPQEVRGTWDLCEVVDGCVGRVIIVRDWKTGAWVPTQQEFDNDRQVGLYLTAAREAFPEADLIRAEFHWIREGVTLTTSWTPAMDRYQRASVKGIARLMLKGYQEPVVGDHCKICDFRLECEAFTNEMKDEIEVDQVADDAHNAELLEERYRVASRLKLLTKYKEDLDRALMGSMEKRSIPMIKLKGHTASFTNRKNKVIDAGRAAELANDLGIPLELLLEKAGSISVTKIKSLVKDDADKAAIDEFTRVVSNKYLTVRKAKK